MVTTYCNRGRGIGRLCPPGLRIQYRLSSLHEYRGGHIRPRSCARTVASNIGRDAESRSKLGKPGQVSASHQGHNYYSIARVEEKATEAEVKARQRPFSEYELY
jgi:hypothetical protein